MRSRPARPTSSPQHDAARRAEAPIGRFHCEKHSPHESEVVVIVVCTIVEVIVVVDVVNVMIVNMRVILKCLRVYKKQKIIIFLIFWMF